MDMQTNHPHSNHSKVGVYFAKGSWIAYLLISLLVLALGSEGFVTSRQLTRKKPYNRRDTNPPFPVDSDETGNDWDLPGVERTSTEAPIHQHDEIPTTMATFISSKRSNISKVFVRKGLDSTSTNFESSMKEESENEELDIEELPATFFDSSSYKELPSENSSGETTSPSLLSPRYQRQSSTTPFSSILANETARNFASRAAIRGLDGIVEPSIHRLNASSEIIRSRGMESYNTSITANNNNKDVPVPVLRAVRPTSSIVSYNPSSYNRVVKRRKITSISSRNISKNVPQSRPEFSITTSSASTDFEDTSLSVDEVEATTSRPRFTFTSTMITNQDLLTPNSVNNNSNSRAIAGFGISKSGSMKSVVNIRPKPIIIRDHEAYFRNASTEPTTKETINSDVEQDTQTPTTEPHLTSYSGNNSTMSPLKVRKVKVTMRRPGPGVVGTVTSDLPVQFVSTTTPIKSTASNDGAVIKAFTTTSSESKAYVATPHIESQYEPGPTAEGVIDYSMEIDPSLSRGSEVPHRNRYTNTEPTFLSRHVFREGVGIGRNSYGHNKSTSNTEDGADGYSYTMEDEEDDLDMDATTEHYYSVNVRIPSQKSQSHSLTGSTGSYTNSSSNNQQFNNFKVDGSISDNDNNVSRAEHVRINTPNYRDYFSEISSSTASYTHQLSMSSPVTSVTITVTKTKTVIHDDSLRSTPTVYNFNYHNHNYTDDTAYQIQAPEIGIGGENSDMNFPNLPTPVLPTTNNSFSFQPSSTTEEKSDKLIVLVSKLEETDAFKNASSNINGIGIERNTIQSAKNTNTDKNASTGLHNSNNDRIIPTNVISANGLTNIYNTKVESSYFLSSSYEFTTSSTSKEHAYFVPNPHDQHTRVHDDMSRDHLETDHHAHDSDISDPHNVIEQIPMSQFNINTTVQFWDTKGLVNASSSQVPVVINPLLGHSTPRFDVELTPPTELINHQNFSSEIGIVSEVAATEQSFPEKESFDKSYPDDDTSVVRLKPSLSTTGIKIKALSAVSVPAKYQVPVLVKMILAVPQLMFCSHLTNFKEMIVMIYGDHERDVDESQIQIFTVPNCTFIMKPIFIPSNSSVQPSPATGSVPTKSTIFPTPSYSMLHNKAEVQTTNKNGSSISENGLKFNNSTGQKSHASSSNTTVPESVPIRRRSPELPDKASTGESLILDSKKKSQIESDGSGGRSSSRENSDTNVNFSSPESHNVLSVYFFANDKQGTYDQNLTIDFYGIWDKSKSPNGNNIQRFFYQRVVKVDMVSTDQLILSDDESNENSGIIAAIAIAAIAATFLFVIGVLLLVLRHRESQTKFAKRCTPVTLDDYSLDNISFSNSFRRKQRIRGSKRSYTNAGFDDNSAPSRVVTASTLHSAVTDTSGLESEFRGIPFVAPTLDDIPHGAEAKNRYANVIPMPDTRVSLTFQDERPNSDYINANYVRGSNGDSKGYIVTQGPLEETVVDFWRMVWEQQVRVIFMLTDFVEAGIPKCSEYYPRSETIDCSQLYGDFQVTLDKRDVNEHSITSYLVIKDIERNLRRDVVHLWYHSWPDRGVPASGKPTVDFLLKSRKFTKEPTPVLVHCSPGTGRSGTLVACDVAMKEFEIQQKTDIAQIVLRIRQDRAGCVQTKEQYFHIYEVLHLYATRFATTKSDSIT